MDIKLTTPFTEEKARKLRAGDSVLLSGTIYTARDAAHKRLVACIEAEEPLPFELQDSIIYYVGPTPAREGEAIGSAGPTTSYRMDAYTPKLLALGHRGMIGKGKRNEEVVKAMQTHGGVYFGAIGGAGALLSSCIVSSEIVAYEDLGAEAIRKLSVENLPLTVIIDSTGANLYQLGRQDYLESLR